MPKSFLNRFNKIYLEELTQADYQCIIERQLASQPIGGGINVEKLLKLSRKVEQLMRNESHHYMEEGAINMRDLSRFFTLFTSFA